MNNERITILSAILSKSTGTINNIIKFEGFIIGVLCTIFPKNTRNDSILKLLKIFRDCKEKWEWQSLNEAQVFTILSDSLYKECVKNISLEYYNPNYSFKNDHATEFTIGFLKGFDSSTINSKDLNFYLTLIEYIKDPKTSSENSIYLNNKISKMCNEEPLTVLSICVKKIYSIKTELEIQALNKKPKRITNDNVYFKN